MSPLQEDQQQLFNRRPSKSSFSLVFRHSLHLQIPPSFRRCTNLLSYLRHRAVERDDDRNAEREKDCRDYAVLWTTVYEAYTRKEKDREQKLGPTGILEYLKQQSEEARVNRERFEVILIWSPSCSLLICTGRVWWNRGVQA